MLHHFYTFPWKVRRNRMTWSSWGVQGRNSDASGKAVLFLVGLFWSVLPIQNCSDVKCSLGTLQESPRALPGRASHVHFLRCDQAQQLLEPPSCFSCPLLGSRCPVPRGGVSGGHAASALSWSEVTADETLAHCAKLLLGWGWSWASRTAGWAVSSILLFVPTWRQCVGSVAFSDCDLLWAAVLVRLSPAF